MSYKVLQSSTIEIPANTSAWGYLSIEGEGALLSLGFANSGFLTQVYPTQLYVTGGRTGFYQIDNLKSETVTVQLYGVADANGNATFGPITDQGSKPVHG